jgi:predicted phage terminase large subunit-like protein
MNASVHMQPHLRDQKLAQALVRDNLGYFVRAAYQGLYGETLVAEPYIDPLCFALQGAAEASTSRLLVNIPPRHLKSFSASVCLPAFVLGKNPTWKIMVVVYGAELGQEHMRAFREITDSRWYRATYPRCTFESIREDAAYTSAGGSLRYVSVGGSVTGLGVRLLIVDDIIKAQDAVSGIRREAVERFVQQTCMTRFDDPRETRVIVISQRLHVHDLASRLLEQGRYSHLNMPSIADREIVLPTYAGQTTRWRPGELLSPTRFPHAELERLRQEMGEAAFSSQFLQKPLPGDGSIIDFARLTMVDEPFEKSELEYTVMSIDPAVKTGEANDFTAITIFGRSAGHWRLVDMLERRLDYVALKDAALGLAEKWRPDLTIIEDCHTGAALWREFPRARFPAFCMKPEGSKAERLATACGYLYGPLLALPQNPPWAERVFAQLRAFPDGHDDIVDSITQFVAWLRRQNVDRLIDQREGRRPSRPRR